nr:SDR family oxidoreductase [Fodinicola feengrottensis]
MKIAVIGTGLIGSQVVRDLTAAGHEVAGHSRSTGLDLLSGEGLDDAVRNAEVAVNLTNSPTFDDASLDFFRTSVTNLLVAAQSAGVGHLVTLSIVGVDQVPDLAYYRAKALQEDLVKAGPIPYSIVRATQFMEFVEPTMSWTTDGDVVRLPTTPIQPISSAEVAAAVAEVAAGAALQGTRNIGGPDVFTLDELGRIAIQAAGDNRRVVIDDETAGLFAAVKGDVLTAPEDPTWPPPTSATGCAHTDPPVRLTGSGVNKARRSHLLRVQLPPASEHERAKCRREVERGPGKDRAEPSDAVDQDTHRQRTDRNARQHTGVHHSEHPGPQFRQYSYVENRVDDRVERPKPNAQNKGRDDHDHQARPQKTDNEAWRSGEQKAEGEGLPPRQPRSQPAEQQRTR